MFKVKKLRFPGSDTPEFPPPGRVGAVSAHAFPAPGQVPTADCGTGKVRTAEESERATEKPVQQIGGVSGKGTEKGMCVCRVAFVGGDLRFLVCDAFFLSLIIFLMFVFEHSS